MLASVTILARARHRQRQGKKPDVSDRQGKDFAAIVVNGGIDGGGEHLGAKDDVPGAEGGADTVLAQTSRTGFVPSFSRTWPSSSSKAAVGSQRHDRNEKDSAGVAELSLGPSSHSVFSPCLSQESLSQPLPQQQPGASRRWRRAVNSARRDMPSAAKSKSIHEASPLESAEPLEPSSPPVASDAPQSSQKSFSQVVSMAMSSSGLSKPQISFDPREDLTHCKAAFRGAVNLKRSPTQGQVPLHEKTAVSPRGKNTRSLVAELAGPSARAKSQPAPGWGFTASLSGMMVTRRKKSPNIAGTARVLMAMASVSPNSTVAPSPLTRSRLHSRTPPLPEEAQEDELALLPQTNPSPLPARSPSASQQLQHPEQHNPAVSLPRREDAQESKKYAQLSSQNLEHLEHDAQTLELFPDSAWSADKMPGGQPGRMSECSSGGEQHRIMQSTLSSLGDEQSRMMQSKLSTLGVGEAPWNPAGRLGLSQREPAWWADPKSNLLGDRGYWRSPRLWAVGFS